MSYETDVADRVSQIKELATQKSFELENVEVADDAGSYEGNSGYAHISKRSSTHPENSPGARYVPVVYYVVRGDSSWYEQRRCYDWINDRLFRYVPAIPEAMDPLIEGARSAGKQICVDAEDAPSDSKYAKIRGTKWADSKLSMTSVLANLRTWGGYAALTFCMEWEGFDAVMDNLNGLSQILLYTAEAEKAVRLAVRADILTIADSTIAALEAVDESDPDDVTVALTIGAAVVAVATAGMSTPWVVAGAVAGAAFSVAGTVLPDEAPKKEEPDLAIGGATVDEVMDSLHGCLSGLDARVSEQGDLIRDSLLATAMYLDSNDPETGEPNSYGFQPEIPQKTEEGDGKPADLADATADDITDVEMLGGTGNEP